MKEYLKDKSALSIPWLESPFAQHLVLNDVNLSMTEKAMCSEFSEKGLIQIDLGFSDEELETIKEDMNDILEHDAKIQPAGYQYNEHLRVFEGWKRKQSILDLARNKKILDILKVLYTREPIPFQTINFTHGSDQPLHSDSLHFHTIPERWMVGVWVALEDMDEENGSLSYIEGSHKLPFYDFQYMNLEMAKVGEQYEKYYEYEEFIRCLIQTLNLKRSILKCKKGTAMIWASNLLHGGTQIKDLNRTRYSQATHYYFEGCQYYYAPMFSNIFQGNILEKNLKNKNILEYVIN